MLKATTEAALKIAAAMCPEDGTLRVRTYSCEGATTKRSDSAVCVIVDDGKKVCDYIIRAHRADSVTWEIRRVLLDPESENTTAATIAKCTNAYMRGKIEDITMPYAEIAGFNLILLGVRHGGVEGVAEEQGTNRRSQILSLPYLCAKNGVLHLKRLPITIPSSSRISRKQGDVQSDTRFTTSPIVIVGPNEELERFHTLPHQDAVELIADAAYRAVLNGMRRGIDCRFFVSPSGILCFYSEVPLGTIVNDIVNSRSHAVDEHYYNWISGCTQPPEIVAAGLPWSTERAVCVHCGEFEEGIKLFRIYEWDRNRFRLTEPRILTLCDDTRGESKILDCNGKVIGTITRSGAGKLLDTVVTESGVGFETLSNASGNYTFLPEDAYCLLKGIEVHVDSHTTYNYRGKGTVARTLIMTEKPLRVNAALHYNGKTSIVSLRADSAFTSTEDMEGFTYLVCIPDKLTDDNVGDATTVLISLIEALDITTTNLLTSIISSADIIEHMLANIKEKALELTNSKRC